MKINIYCLLDPEGDIPFYVGATKRPLKIRLHGHVTGSKRSESKTSIANLKIDKIAEIVARGQSPKIILLESVELDKSNECEKKYYNQYVSSGFKMLQSKSQFNFTSRMGSSVETETLTATIPIELEVYLRELSKEEKRTFSQMVAILLDEALKARKAS